MHIKGLSIVAALLLAPLMVTPSLAQQNGDQPVDSGTQWNPEELPVQNVFDYGAKEQPTLVCAPKQYCAIALEAGETVNTVEADDNHWSVTPTTYGAGKFAKPVLLITPREAGYSDELVISSVAANHQARNYRIKLMSDAEKFTHLTGFRYPMAQ